MENRLPFAGETHILDNQHRGIQGIAGKLIRQLAIFYGLGNKTGCQMINGGAAPLSEKLKEWFGQTRLGDFVLRKMAFEHPKRDMVGNIDDRLIVSSPDFLDL